MFLVFLAKGDRMAGFALLVHRTLGFKSYISNNEYGVHK